MFDKVKQLPLEALKGTMLSFLYFTITQANDTTLRNLTLYVIFYLICIVSAILVDISTTVVTTAFFTKTIFTLVDERVKRQENK